MNYIESTNLFKDQSLPENYTDSALRPNIERPDGSILKWLTNNLLCGSINEEGTSPFNPYANTRAVWLKLSELCVVEIPEVEALDNKGNSLLGGTISIYVDSRLDRKKILGLMYNRNYRKVGDGYVSDPSWLNEQDPRLDSSATSGVLVPTREISSLVDQWMIETGMDKEVAALLPSSEQLASPLPSYDLDNLMRAVGNQLGKPLK